MRLKQRVTANIRSSGVTTSSCVFLLLLFTSNIRKRNYYKLHSSHFDWVCYKDVGRCFVVGLTQFVIKVFGGQVSDPQL